MKRFHTFRNWTLYTLLLIGGAMPAAADSEMMYVYKGGRIVYAQEVTAVDDVQVAEDHSRLTILDKEGATLY